MQKGVEKGVNSFGFRPFTYGKYGKSRGILGRPPTASQRGASQFVMLLAQVYVQVGRLKGLERNTQSHTEAIYVVAQLSQGGEAISLPVPTPPCCTSADSHAWDVWLSFPVKVRCPGAGLC